MGQGEGGKGRGQHGQAEEMMSKMSAPTSKGLHAKENAAELRKALLNVYR